MFLYCGPSVFTSVYVHVTIGSPLAVSSDAPEPSVLASSLVLALVSSELDELLLPPQAASTRALARSAKRARIGHFEPLAMRRVDDFIDSPPQVASRTWG